MCNEEAILISADSSHSWTGATSFAYDASGNLTQSGSNFFCYDAENRLLGEGASSTDCSSLAQLTYDPLGRLVTTEAGGSTTRLVYDGDDLVAEYNSAGTLLRRYLHGPGTDDPLVQYEGATVASTAERHLYSDAQGSIIAATDNAGNLIAGSIDKYDEYGIPLTDSAGHSLNSGRFQYTGQQWIGEVGMYYYKARFYSPTLGRFMQTDPVGYDDQVNLYAYVGDDPIDRADPTGDAGACGFICTLLGGPVPLNGANGQPIGYYNHELVTDGMLVGGVAGSAPYAVGISASAGTAAGAMAVDALNVGADATPAQFRNAEQLGAQTMKQEPPLKMELGAKPRDPLAGTKAYTHEVKLATRTEGLQIERAKGMLGRPDQVGLRARPPQSTMQTAVDVVRQSLDAVKHFFSGWFG